MTAGPVWRNTQEGATPSPAPPPAAATRWSPPWRSCRPTRSAASSMGSAWTRTAWRPTSSSGWVSLEEPWGQSVLPPPVSTSQPRGWTGGPPTSTQSSSSSRTSLGVLSRTALVHWETRSVLARETKAPGNTITCCARLCSVQMYLTATDLFTQLQTFDIVTQCSPVWRYDI